MELTSDDLDGILENLLVANPDIQGAAIVSNEGLPIASALLLGVDETRMAAMSAAILSTSVRGVQELKRGDLKRIIIEGGAGIVIMSKAGKNAILIVIAKPGFDRFSLNRFIPQGPFNPSGFSGATASAEKDLLD